MAILTIEEAEKMRAFIPSSTMFKVWDARDRKEAFITVPDRTSLCGKRNMRRITLSSMYCCQDARNTTIWALNMKNGETYPLQSMRTRRT